MSNPMLSEMRDIASPKARFTREFLSIPDKSVICGTSSSKPKILYLEEELKYDFMIKNNLLEDAPCGKNDKTVLDKTFRKTRRIADLSKISVDWAAGLEEAKQKIETELLTPPNTLVKKKVVGFDLHSILLYSQSDFFNLHRDSKKKPNHELTISVNVEMKGMKKVKCVGGGLRFPHADIGYDENSKEEEQDDEDSLDSPLLIDAEVFSDDVKTKQQQNNKNSNKSLKTNGLLPCGVWNTQTAGSWAAWFATEPHQVEKVHSGERMAVIFNVLTEVVVEEETEQKFFAPPPSSSAELKLSSRLFLKSVVEQQQRHFPMGGNNKKRLGVILCHQYSTDGAAEVPRSSLRGRDAKIVAAMENNDIFKFKLVQKGGGTSNDENNDNNNRRRVRLLPIHIIVEQPRFDSARVSSIMQRLTFGTFAPGGLKPPEISEGFRTSRDSFISTFCDDVSPFITFSNDLMDYPESIRNLVTKECEKRGKKLSSLTSSTSSSAVATPTGAAGFIVAGNKSTISNINNNSIKQRRQIMLDSDQMKVLREVLKKHAEKQVGNLRSIACMNFSDEYHRQTSTMKDEMNDLLFDQGRLILATELRDLRQPKKERTQENDVDKKKKKKFFSGVFVDQDDDTTQLESNNTQQQHQQNLIEEKPNNNDMDDGSCSSSSSSSTFPTDETVPPATLRQIEKLIDRQDEGFVTTLPGGYSNDDTACIAAKPLQDIAVSNGLAVFIRASGLIDVIDGSSEKILWGNDEMFEQYWLRTTMAVIDFEETSGKTENMSGQRRERDE